VSEECREASCQFRLQAISALLRSKTLPVHQGFPFSLSKFFSISHVQDIAIFRFIYQIYNAIPTCTYFNPGGYLEEPQTSLDSRLEGRPLSSPPRMAGPAHHRTRITEKTRSRDSAKGPRFCSPESELQYQIRLTSNQVASSQEASKSTKHHTYSSSTSGI